MVASNHHNTSTGAKGRPDPSRLRGMILLCGGVRPNPLSILTGRSVLDLPLTCNETIFDRWVQHADEVARTLELDRFTLQAVSSRGCPLPKGRMQSLLTQVSVDIEPQELRGTGGLLFDLAQAYDDDDLLIVAAASQLPLVSLSEVVNRAIPKLTDISLICNNNAKPSGLMLVRCGALRGLSDVGYIDFKQQALPQLVKSKQVSVTTWNSVTAPPVRNLGNYLSLVGELNHQSSPGGKSKGFLIIEPGAQLSPQAQARDSVVLAGATVDPGALLVSSLVCENAHVRFGRIAVGTTIKQTADMSGHEA